MLRKTLAAAAGLILLSALLTGGRLPSQNTAAKSKSKKKAITWHTFEKGVAEATKQKKLMVVDFYTDWCKWCKVMDEKTYSDARVIQFAKDKLVMSRVNAESQEKVRFKGQEFTYAQLARAFGVKAFPTTVFIDPKGEFLTAVPGYLTPEQFLPILEYLSSGQYEKMTFEQFMKKKKDES